MAIDFSLPSAAVDSVEALAAAGVDVVLGTTGWYDRLAELTAAVERARVGLIWAPNFSIGVHLFSTFARSLARLVDALSELEPYDVHLSEAHHRHKLDHPSGTARHLAEMLIAELESKNRWVAGPPEGAADPSALYVTSVRAGEIPGTHVVGVEGRDDRIEVKHEARGRTGFARGALAAAQWIRGREGIFTLDDILTERLSDREAER